MCEVRHSLCDLNRAGHWYPERSWVLTEAKKQVVGRAMVPKLVLLKRVNEPCLPGQYANMSQDHKEYPDRMKLLTGLIITVVLVLTLALILSRNMDGVRAFLLQSGQIGLLISIALYGLLGASPIPSEPLTVLLSALYGPLPITIVATLGNLLAALVEYYIGRRIGDVADFEQRRQKLPFGLGRFPANSVIFLIVARFLPGYGAKFISVLSGIYKVPLWRYTWTTILSTLIGAAIIAYGGFGLLNLFNK
jgi:uncharacterized membrane protein YdjX (TVP38/TMEM64 family)